MGGGWKKWDGFFRSFNVILNEIYLLKVFFRLYKKKKAFFKEILFLKVWSLLQIRTKLDYIFVFFFLTEIVNF